MVIEPFLSGSITLSVVFVVSGNAGASAAIAGIAHRLRAKAALNRPVRKRFAFFISVPLLLKKVIIGWAAKPPGLGVLHQHGVQCGALQRGNAAAPPALCREEKRKGKPGRLPTWLKAAPCRKTGAHWRADPVPWGLLGFRGMVNVAGPLSCCSGM